MKPLKLALRWSLSLKSSSRINITKTLIFYKNKLWQHRERKERSGDWPAELQIKSFGYKQWQAHCVAVFSNKLTINTSLHSVVFTDRYSQNLKETLKKFLGVTCALLPSKDLMCFFWAVRKAVLNSSLALTSAPAFSRSAKDL